MARCCDVVLFMLLAALVLLVWNNDSLSSAMHWDWGALARAFYSVLPDGSYRPGPLGIGLANTLRLSLWTMFFGGIAGLYLGITRNSKYALLQTIASVWVNSIRNLPPLVLMFIVHYFLTGVLVNGLSWGAVDNIPVLHWLFPPSNRMPVFFSAIIALSLYQGAYAGEIIRSGIANIPKPQWEAAASLGFSSWMSLRLIILPQAVRHILPALTGQAASLIKDTAIVSVISIQELTFQATEYMASSGLVGEIWAATVLCYLGICLATSIIGALLERYYRRYSL